MGSEKTKSAEQEVLEVYQAYINAYLSGDIERMVTDFAEDVVIIGSAGGEIFNNKAEVTQYYKSTANQVAGIVELRNRNLRVQVQGLTALIVEQTDLCVQMDGEWSLYSPFRVTTHLSHKEGQWFIVLQHGSVPDARAGEGEQLNTDDLKAENVRLQEAIKRRTIELEVKNREQEIEASVERVRSKSLAMSQSTEIQQVINTVFEQLGGLGLEMNVASIFIFKEGSKDWEQWVASADTSYSTCFSIPFYDHPIFWDLDKARKAHKAFYTIKYPKKIKDQWFDYAFTHTEYQRIPDQRKAYLLNSEFFLVAFALSAHTGIQLSKYAGDAFTEEDQRILQRFSIVFEQAYTRFLDLQKAETQTREAQIQLALERVRAATMSMFRSEDLGKVAQILFLQMQQLGKGLDRAMIPIVDTRTHSANAWMTTEDGAGVKDGIQVSWLGHPVLNEVYEAWLREEAFIEQDLVGTRLDEFIHWIQANTTTPYSQNQPKRRVYGYARFSYGMIAIIKSTGITTEERNILIRFAKVFEQTYTRFLDLKKAEAQAREAQIETALERVRAHTMAMHQSSELSATAVILFNQLRSLNLMPENIRVFFSLIDTQSDSAEVWMTSKDGHFRPGSHRIPMLNEKELAQIYQLWKDKVPLLIRDLSGKRLEDYHRFLRTLPHVTRDDGFREMLDHPPERFVLTEASHRFGTIGITSFEPLSVEAGNLLVRFSKVFEQTYTRFLDLQKAEIQAREAQIEAALERVRAKTMAMHNSEEVGETIVLLFDELTRLGLEKQARCGIGILDESKFMELWTASLEQEGQVRLNIGRIDMTKHPLLTAGREAWKNDQPDFIYVLEGEDLIRYFSIINDEPDYTYHIDLNNLPGKLIFNEFVFPNGMLYAFTRDPLSEEMVRICRRFATVFGQTYRRYKDLIRVEEQAREAQIQLSLERVRASSLAMKQSDELSDTAMLMAQQIRDLGIAAWGCAFHIYADDDEGDYEWFSSEEGHLPFYKTPREKFFLRYYEMRESGETIYIQPFSGEACKAHYEYLLSLPVVGDALGALRDSGTPLPTHQIDHVVFFQHGYLLFITYDPVPQAYDIFRRFAVEFEQAFTRFLDLKKVEEQAREKEIQLALERVRARTMAMQKSDELAEVVQELFRQIRPLDPSAQWGCAILLVDTVREGFHLWFSVPTNPLLPVSVFIHHLDNQVINKCWEEYQKGTDQFRIELKEDEKKSWEDHLFSTTEMGKLPPEMQQAIRAEKYVMFSYASMRFGLLEAISHVPISGELNELLPRFAKVFEQTYTRFQDLQKAEAQAREAHIEAALERVRSRSMAMHKSKDLSEVVKLLYKETEAFGISTFGISIAIFQEEDHSAEYWFADNLNSNLLRSYKVPGPGHPVFQQIWKDWKLHLLQNNIYLEGSEKSDYDDWILGETEFSKLPAELKQEIKSHDTVCFTFTYFKYGYFESVDLSVPPEDSAKILIRFSKVFEQTYTRFLDLQKAEAQAREAQIEAALEKVRSRTIGMRHSDELAEAASLLFREVQALGIPVWSCGYNILSADQLSCTSIMSAEGGLQEPLEIPLTEHESFLPWRNAILNKDDFLVYRMEGEDLEAHYRYMQTLPGFKEFERSGIELPACQINHLVRFNQGFLLFIASVEIPSAYDIFKRFGVVFKQTYTRFLDLQKAEAQARESEIQLALERVRARTMAMHHSLDLRDVVFVLFQQVNGLNIADLGCNINLFYPENRIIETWLAGTDQEPIPKSYFIQVDHPYLTQMWSSWENQDAPFLIYSTGASHESYKNLILETCYQDMPDEFKAYVRENPEAYLVHFNMLCGQIQAVSSKTLSEESISVLQRFAAVFQQSYTRFLDLKNAEAQTREAEIQLALERVRARTMAMHQSDELRSVIHTIFEQLKALGFDATACGLTLFNKEDKSMELWLAGFETDAYPESYFVPYFDHPLYNAQYGAWANGQAYQVFKFEGELKKSYDDLIFELGGYKDLPASAKEAITSIESATNCTAFMKYGMFESVMIGDKMLTEQQADTLQRLAKVFEQTYTRFLDLQKAEAQAQEAQIEAALERVRSRTMAMHHSNELSEAAIVLFDQIKQLGIETFASGFNIWDHTHENLTAWMSNATGSIQPPFVLPINTYDQHKKIHKAWKNKEAFLVDDIKGKAMVNHYRFLRSFPVLDESFKQAETAGIKLPDRQVHNIVPFSQGYLLFITLEPRPEFKDIFLRFGKVFEQTYTRFLDLQKAENQAKEAQIEAALERVRAESMAMHKSTGLEEVVAVMFRELDRLQLNVLRCGIGILSEKEKIAEVWTTTRTEAGYEVNISGNESMEIHPVLQGAYEAWQKKEDFYYTFTIPDLIKYHQAVKDAEFHLPEQATEDSQQYYFATFFPAGGLYAFSESPIEAETTGVIRRFARTFHMAYQRYLDLQKAEDQAREAQIEAALERVRSRTIGMQRSEELQDAAFMLFQQVEGLGVPVFGCGFNIWDEDHKAATAWMGGKDRIQPPFKTNSSEDVFLRIAQAAASGESLFVEEQRGAVLDAHYEYMYSIPVFKEIVDKMAVSGQSVPTFQIIHCAFFSQGYLMFISYEPVAYAYDIFEKMARVFEQTYTRFQDLRKAEAQTWEAIRQTSLDRIRGEIASMRTADDLERITPLIWKELMALGVPFIRCGVFIMDDENEIIHNYLSTPDGNAIATFHLPYSTPGSMANILLHWQKKQKLIDHWDNQAMLDFANVLVDQGIYTSTEEYLHTLPSGGFYLHFLPFSQGMLYVGNTALLSGEQIDLLQLLAKAFSTAYARYEDFNRLEVAKNQVDKTLVDLKQTQQQLIQSEKMASLGELTAGIAHEIQNPLNFVNNFSEVNQELISELKEAIQRNDQEEIEHLVQDLLDNEAKVNQHGKRAEGIVRSMLQHSRTSSGQKVDTDINALCDEYLRLAYHGFRAKDKSFNAQLDTDFDRQLPRLEVVAQDIGRVLLNLINNAFQACAEQDRSEGTDREAKADPLFKPLVTVSTKRLDDAIEIRVSDNGSGIPDSIKDKIFQPFFTTKPTGQGTGLGLSLSYDIVKAHGGDIEVDSESGKGTKFIVRLPV